MRLLERCIRTLAVFVNRVLQLVFFQVVLLQAILLRAVLFQVALLRLVLFQVVLLRVVAFFQVVLLRVVAFFLLLLPHVVFLVFLQELLKLQLQYQDLLWVHPPRAAAASREIHWCPRRQAHRRRQPRSIRYNPPYMGSPIILFTLLDQIRCLLYR